MTANVEKRVSELFERFAAIYGRQWTSRFDSGGEADERLIGVAMAEWAEVLRGLSDDQIDRGIRAAKTACEWPPSIAEFARLALGMPEAGQVVARAMRGEEDALVKAVCRAAGGRRSVMLAEQREAARIVERVYSEIVQSMIRDVSEGIEVDPVARLEQRPADPQKRQIADGAQSMGEAIPESLTGADA